MFTAMLTFFANFMLSPSETSLLPHVPMASLSRWTSLLRSSMAQFPPLFTGEHSHTYLTEIIYVTVLIYMNTLSTLSLYSNSLYCLPFFNIVLGVHCDICQSSYNIS
jgi:hypothetical protein